MKQFMRRSRAGKANWITENVSFEGSRVHLFVFFSVELGCFAAIGFSSISTKFVCRISSCKVGEPFYYIGG